MALSSMQSNIEWSPQLDAAGLNVLRLSLPMVFTLNGSVRHPENFPEAI
jgi:hypothetical protein